MRFFAFLQIATALQAQAVISSSQPTNSLSGDTNGSNFTYPWPVHLFNFTSQLQNLSMAYMDISPPSPSFSPSNGSKVAVLLHGKNFCGATWEGTVRALLSKGYRLILPDQIGFCKSSKPSAYQFTFHQLAANTLQLLKSLDVSNITLIGHSMGGMLATRFALLYPDTVKELAMVNPLGLEDWIAKGVPYQTIEKTRESEAASNYASIRAYQQATYYVNTWKDEYDVWVNMLVNIYFGSQRENFVLNQAQVTDMVLTQPVVYEFRNLKMRSLLVVGKKDTTAIGKQWSPPDVQARIGHYDVLGKEWLERVNGGKGENEGRGTLVEFEDLGHAPQIQEPGRWYDALLGWLGEQ